MAKSVLIDLTIPELAAKARLEKPHRLREIRREIARCETRASQLSKKS